MEKILSGTPVAKLIKAKLSLMINELSLKPQMALIQVGYDSASTYYVQNIVKQAAKLGSGVSLFELPLEISTTNLSQLIVDLNHDDSIDGIMIQKPLPKHIDENSINSIIHPEKDIDAINPVNIGKLLLEYPLFTPCTPQAVFLMMRYYGIDASGKNVVIIGRSNVVGKPMAAILLSKKSFCNATVTICHSKTQDLLEHTTSADILVSAIGKANYVTPEMIVPGAIVLDVGINEEMHSEGAKRFVGDVDYHACLSKVEAITPVPGGVGSVTTAVLLLNLVKAALLNKKMNKIVDGFDDLIFNAKQIN